jgi:hypothetical protein
MMPKVSFHVQGAFHVATKAQHFIIAMPFFDELVKDANFEN